MAKGDGRIVSFARTVDALFADPNLETDPFGKRDPALQKTETRRYWKDSYARQFKKGDQIQAYDRNSRAGGKRMALLRLTQDPYQESLRGMPGNAWYREGFEYLQQMGAKMNGLTPSEFWEKWRQSDGVVWVICFELIKDCREKVLTDG